MHEGEGAGGVDFSDPTAFIYAEGVAFTDWTTRTLPSCSANTRISDLRAARPTQ